MPAPTTFALTTFCTPEDISARIRDASFALNLSQNDPSAGATVQDKITLVKPSIRRDIEEVAKVRFPSTIGDLIRQAQRLRKEAEDRVGANNIDGRIQPTYVDNTPDLVDSVSATVRPALYYYAGTPVNGTSGTEAGYASPGSFLVDTTNRLVYINRGTLASPTWSRFVVKDLVDYISNPADVKDAYVSRVVHACLQDGSVRDKSGYERDSDWMNGLLSFWEHQYKEDWKQAAKALDFDITGDGTLDNYEVDQGNTGEDIFS